MISILASMDEHDIAYEVRMERMVHKGSFLLLEGKQDVNRFKAFLDTTSCSVVCTHSVRKAGLALRLLERRGVQGIVAVLDADFRRLLGLPVRGRNIVFSEFHDLDLDWMLPSVLERYFLEVAEASKVASRGGIVGVIEDLLERIFPVSCAKFLNAQRVFKFKVNNVDIAQCFDGGGDLIESFIDQLVALGNVAETERAYIRQTILAECATSHDRYQITNGHDLLGALGVVLRNEIGNRKVPQTWANEIGIHIRLAINHGEFLALHVAKEILAWEARNAPYKVLN